MTGGMAFPEDGLPPADPDEFDHEPFTDPEAEQELAGALQIRAIPTLMVFRDGILLLSESGALPASALDELVAKASALDMDEVRREIAAEMTDAEIGQAQRAARDWLKSQPAEAPEAAPQYRAAA